MIIERLSQEHRNIEKLLAILERIADAVPRAQRHLFRGAGHIPHISHPDDYALVVGSFVTGVAGAT